ncbi:hypothetical protein [Pilimelia columellifera]|uniref:Uncharacterized protein n=1 Tax=Pilimelia columellifera subsp. columellifera TaxID=706583 RepID=A0ABP6B4S9_9ACTN
MSIRSFEGLQRADERTLRCLPGGLGVGLQLRPEDAAEYQQEVAGRFTLDDRVAEGTRNSYEHLRTVFAYGVLCYEIYTLVGDHALLVIEQALRDRFVDFHGGTVTFIDHIGAEHHVAVARYVDVHSFLRANRPPRGRQCWRLRLARGATMAFRDGMLHDLRTWARKAGLLRGQRNHGIERALVELRNFVAHPTGYQLYGPVEAARTLHDLAEIINQLWGASTPGGRLYPAPTRREVVVMAWSTDGSERITVTAEALADSVDPDDRPWQCIILRAVFRPDEGYADPALRSYDSRVEATLYPTDLLWGPGTITDAAAWYAQHKTQSDMIDHLDQTFLIRHHDDLLCQPVRPQHAAAAPCDAQAGTWYAVKADHPNDAYQHVRNIVTAAGCQPHGQCNNCHAETLNVGPHHTATAGTLATVPLPPDVATPWAQPRAREMPA